MLMFVLIGLSLALLGIVGLQFTYMFYVERLNGERRKHIQALEHNAGELVTQLDAANRKIAKQDELLKAAYPELKKTEEAWADVIEER
jgi:hypothetical protein